MPRRDAAVAAAALSCAAKVATHIAMEDAADHGVAAVIMVISTPEAEAIVRKSGLSVVDLFRPFGDVEDLNGASRSLPAACAIPLIY